MVEENANPIYRLVTLSAMSVSTLARGLTCAKYAKRNLHLALT